MVKVLGGCIRFVQQTQSQGVGDLLDEFLDLHVLRPPSAENPVKDSGVSPVQRPTDWGRVKSGERQVLGLSPKAWEPGVQIPKGRRRWMSQLKQRKGICPSFCFSSFCLYLFSTDWRMSICTGEGNLLHSVWFLVNLFQRHIHRDKPKVMFYHYRASPGSVKLTLINLTITEDQHETISFFLSLSETTSSFQSSSWKKLMPLGSALPKFLSLF